MSARIRSRTVAGTGGRPTPSLPAGHCALRPLDRRLLADPLDRAPRNLEMPGYLSDMDPGRQHLLYCVPVDHPEHPLRLR
jgi:hypothetical protein